MNTQDVLGTLEQLLGPQGISTAVASYPQAVAGWTAQPFAAVFPDSATQVAKIVRIAETAGIALIPRGGGTHLHACAAPVTDSPILLLSSQQMNRITDYQPDDLTVTCEPGVTLAALQATLAERRQMLHLDIPLPAQATVGGIVSANASGFWRHAYGTPRDLLIGMRAVLTGGVEVKGGGKVVKNVAGYDVCKLFNGAWGTLGFLTEVTFKVRPVPEIERVLAWRTPDLATAARLGLALHQARLAPTYLLATNEIGALPHVVVGLHGTAARVTWQAEDFARRVAEVGVTSVIQELSTSDADAFRDRQARLEPDIRAAVVACLPTDLEGILLRLQSLPLSITAQSATGIVSLAAHDPAFDPVKEIRHALPENANVAWNCVKIAEATPQDTPARRLPNGTEALDRSLKQAIDPRDTFFPGSLFGRTA